MHITEQDKKRLEYLLNNWVDYYSRGGDANIGYPSMSPEARMRANGGVTLHSEHTYTPRMNHDAQMIEELVLDMAKSHFEYADALRARYFAKDSDYPLSNAAKKKRRDVVSKLAYQRHISNRMFQVRVKCAKIWLLEKIGHYEPPSKKNNNYYLHKLAA